MKTILDYVEAWDLADLQLMCKTPTSHLYKATWRDQPAVVKLFTTTGIECERAGAALRCFNGRGAAHLLRHDDKAQLLEYLEGEDLRALVERGDDLKATAIIADVLQQIHNAHPGPAPDVLMLLVTHFRALFEKANYDRNSGSPSVYIKGAEVAEALLSEQKNLCILHGDMHHENIKLSPTRGWLSIDPKGVYGEKTYDAANVLCNPMDMDGFVANEARLLKNAEVLAKALEVETKRLLAFTFAYACLSASWSLEDDQDPTLALRIAAIAEAHAGRG